jgi:hypothetical protein
LRKVIASLVEGGGGDPLSSMTLGQFAPKKKKPPFILILNNNDHGVDVGITIVI